MTTRRQLVQDVGSSDDDEGEDRPHVPGFRMNQVLRSGQGGEEEDLGDGEDEEEGEDLEDHMEEDYREMKELDQYDARDLDDAEYEEMDQATLQRVEDKLAKRDRQESRNKRGLPRSLMLGDDDEEDSGRRRRRRRKGDGDDEEDDDFFSPQFTTHSQDVYEGEGRIELDLENFDSPSLEFLSSDAVKYEVIERMVKFIKTFVAQPQRRDDKAGTYLAYVAKINDMCSRNLQSLHVSYIDLSSAQPQLAILLAEHPKILLPYLDLAAKRVCNERFPDYYKIHSKVFVRITHLPSPESLRDLRCVHLNSFIKVSGVVTRRTGVLPQLKEVIFRCVSCESFTDPMLITANTKSRRSMPLAPSQCDRCQGKNTMRFDQERTIYGNFQRITLQESPGTVPAGRVPRQKDVVLLDDLIDSARPGEEIEVTGVFVSHVDRGLNMQNKFPVFSTVLEANFVQKREDLISTLRITDADRRQLKKISQDPRVVERICQSIAPSIYGQEKVKTALALAMFGGREKNIDDKHRIRGDINVLLLGDPGTAKSQCLKYVEKTAPRAVFTTGKGASAVGLTASVHKDAITGEWTLEGGALVLADRGVCLIDEFDKMSSKDRTSIHEAMEQQQISISKAGIVTTLQARCSVIAAANPIGGRYDAQRSFTENVELTDPIIQRFDCLCVLQDVVNQSDDERLAKFVVASHVRSHPDSNTVINVFDGNTVLGQQRNGEGEGDLLNQETLRKYIIFSKSIRPRLNPSVLDQEKIVDVYVQLRKHSGGGDSVNAGGVPIGVRHCESIIRMAEAFARMHLRDFVHMDDFDRAIGVMVNSFIDAQRYSARRMLTRAFGKFISFKRDNDELLMYLLQELVKEHHHHGNGEFSIPCGDFFARAKELNCDRFVNDFYRSKRFRAGQFRVESGAIIRG
ncbi:hypothetical protein BASA81_002331 [Batrachochytrium salamandrivorans]|nr:hypothetical protein BASA81_002331 [Batrachochytrium salamandrivorans]